VLAETALVARQQITESLGRLRGELKALTPRLKNLQSQLTRARNPEDPRLVRVREQLAAGDAGAARLRQHILRLEKCRIDEKDLRRALGSFDSLWKAMTMEEQRGLVGLMVEKAGYDGRTGKVTISFVSTAVKELVQKGSSR
jgi:hypothetical protein